MKKYHLKNRKSQKRKNYRGGEYERVEFKQCTPPVIYRKRVAKPKNSNEEVTDDYNNIQEKRVVNFVENGSFFKPKQVLHGIIVNEGKIEHYQKINHIRKRKSRFKIETDQPGEEKPPRKGEKT